MCERKEILTSALIFVTGLFCLAIAPVALFRALGLRTETQGGKAADGQTAERQRFEIIQVRDSGKPLWEKTWGEEEGESIVYRYDYFAEEQCLKQEDGAVCADNVDTMHLNDVWFSVPAGGTRGFGDPVFSSALLTKAQRQAQQEWNDRDVTSVQYEKAFQRKIELAREMIREGYLQDYLAGYLQQYPEIDPQNRVWTLEYMDGGWTDRPEDGVRWCDLRYRLITTAENGEIVAVGRLEIHQNSLVSDHAARTEVSCVMDPVGSGIGRLLSDGSSDGGEIRVGRVHGQNFPDEATARDFVEQRGAALMLPEGADQTVRWKYRPEQGYWYTYLVCEGRSADYDITIAIPLMTGEEDGWYAASRIRKQADNKSACAYALSAVMQTLRITPYVYCVREGDTLTDIGRRYAPDERPHDAVCRIAERNGIDNPDLIYPGQRLILPEDYTGKAWKAGLQ